MDLWQNKAGIGPGFLYLELTKSSVAMLYYTIYVIFHLAVYLIKGLYDRYKYRWHGLDRATERIRMAFVICYLKQ